MRFYHDSRDEAYRSPYGAAPAGERVTLCLDAPGMEAGHIFLRLWTDQETLIPMTLQENARWRVTISLPESPGLVWYYFAAELGEKTVYYGHPAGSAAGTGEIMASPESWQITVYQPSRLPGWYKNALVYQIFPDRFARGADWLSCQENAAHPAEWKGPKRMVMQDWDDTPFYCRDEQLRVTRWPFFGGNLRGVREKLPYLKSLGVGAIYLNPIFLASSNHKYDTADYSKIDPAFGDEAEFRALCAQAAEMGIRVILDGVFSHTGDDSVYFNRWGNFPRPGAFSPEKSPYDSWYRFGEEYPAGYECWWGVDSLPDVEEMDPGFLELICGENGIIRKWLRAGASGWRLDVADELPDAFIAAVRAACKAEKPDALLLGEVWEDASRKVSYGVQREYLFGNELDCTMHYPFRVGVLDFMLGKTSGAELAATLETIRENYPPSALYGALNLLGTHDTPRILTLLGEAPENLEETQRERYRLPEDRRQLALQRLKLLDLLMFASPGVPCVYYGDEAGMEGFADPFNRGTFPWGKENAGLQYHVRMLSALRKEYPVLVEGDTRYFSPAPAVFGLYRRLGDALVYCYVNRSEKPETVSLPDLSWLDLLTGDVFDGDTLTLGPLSGVLLCHMGPQRAFSPLAAAAAVPEGTGVLCPLFSLPGQQVMGAPAEEFLKALSRAGYQSWMLLPLCPPGDGDSPYSSRGLFAGDVRWIDRDQTPEQADYLRFCRENAFWLEDYALYTILRAENGNTPWQTWPEDQRDRRDLPALRRRYHRETEEIFRQQYRFAHQWEALRKKAGEMGISLIGDLPIYAAVDGADTWAHRELFQLDQRGYPVLRAGCPPDYFSPQGQDWGNPLYDWAAMEKDGFAWWKARLRQALARFDYVRLDHFRGFAAYYAIPAGATAKDGFWMKGPGLPFFRALADAFGSLPILAEDLGQLDSQVTVLLRQTGLCGMNVWQFTPGEMETMPPEEAAHRVFFSGTHDNQTLKGFLEESGQEAAPEDVLRRLKSAPAAAVIFPVQDILGLGDEARINVPGVPTGNWTWKMTPEMLRALSRNGILSEEREGSGCPI